MVSTKINIGDYDYELPENRIAQYPENERDGSRLLLYDGQNIAEDIFRNLDRHISDNSLLVFNNTRVIRARILFRKYSGALIEILCNEPLSPPEYEKSFASHEPVEWKCIIGNLKKWKTGPISTPFRSKGREYLLNAERISTEGETWRIRFSWNNDDITFGEVLEATGHIPLPPYIDREDEKEDSIRYQTIYSAINGSVASPTAGLHFTDYVLKRLSEKGVGMANITLHVGAGTFKPVRTNTLSDHIMHSEHFYINSETIKQLLEYQGRIIAVGTTSVRALESLYWLGVKTLQPDAFDFNYGISQWEPYRTDTTLTVKDSLTALYNLMTRDKLTELQVSTRFMIIPGYEFKTIDGIITNFHQPKSSLLLLISAWTGPDWKRIYRYALKNGFRFLSYGDTSLLYKPHNKRII